MIGDFVLGVGIVVVGAIAIVVAVFENIGFVVFGNTVVGDFVLGVDVTVAIGKIVDFVASFEIELVRFIVNVVVLGKTIGGDVVVVIVDGVVVGLVIIVIAGNILVIGMLFCLNCRFLLLLFCVLLNSDGTVVFVIGDISLVEVKAIVIIDDVVLPGNIEVSDMVLGISVIVVGNLLVVVIVVITVFEVFDVILTGVFGNIVIGDTLRGVVVIGAIILLSGSSLNRSI